MAINNNDNSPRSSSSSSSSPITSTPRPNAGAQYENEQRSLIIEPATFLFMCTALAKFPVFQSLLYEKACLGSGRFDAETCWNISATHADLELQGQANHLLMASTLCLLLPSIPTALLLGAMFDSWSSRKTLLIPLAGLLLADANYVLQSGVCMGWSPYWLLLSDLFYGFAGGFSSIIGLFFAYSIRVTPPIFRPTRVALMEGSLGLGGMCGYLLSGQLRQKVGYAWFFTLLAIFHFFVVGQVLCHVRELATTSPVMSEGEEKEKEETKTTTNVDENDGCVAAALRPSSSSSSGVPFSGSLSSEISARQQSRRAPLEIIAPPKCWSLCRNRLTDVLNVYTAEREPNTRKCLNIVLVALALELVSFSGLMDILFSFLRFKLQWTDKEYGWFNGAGTGSGSLCVILLYPLLQKRVGISNLRLTLFGLLTKICSVLVLAFAGSTLLALISLLPALFSRFVPTGLRAMASACVSQQEQGRIFSLISLLESLAFVAASVLFNGLYPLTLQLFAGTMLLAIAALLLLPVAILVYADVRGL